MIEKEYKNWIIEVSKRFKQSQIKAAMKVNSEMIKFFWTLGYDMHIMKGKYTWGNNFYEKISRDLRKALPTVKSFSTRNLLYMHQFYRMFPQNKFTNQNDFQLTGIPHQVGAEITKHQIMHQVDAKAEEKNFAFYIPWGQMKLIMDKCNGNREKALFFVNKTFENNWSRAVLLNFLDTDLYERQGKAVTNFNKTLPVVQGDLAQAITKDPYNFDFLSIRDKYDEKELKDALMDNITKFLLELGNGFSFVGREFKIDIGNTENFIDMLFFNINLKCYVVLEVKVTDFDSSFTGKLGTYVVAVNHQLKKDWMSPTIGLLVCKGINKIEAKYALEASTQPIGVSEYELSKLIPKKYKGSLPTIEEIEAELENIKINK